MNVRSDVGHSLRSTPTDGLRFLALAFPGGHPLKVGLLTEIDVAQLQRMRVTCHLSLVTAADLCFTSIA